jgi:DNA-binding MarR family transcriptional regulator
MYSEKRQLDNLKYLIESYKKVIDLLLVYRDREGISRIPQTKIAEVLRISQTNVSKKLKTLIKFGAIERVGHAGAYRVKDTNVIERTPLGLMLKLSLLLQDHPEMITDYSKQAELMGVSYRDIQVAWGHMIFIGGSPYKTTQAES